MTDASLKKAQEAERKRFTWLRDWKTQLITDLNTGRYRAAVSDIPGVEYEGVLNASEREIVLRVPGGKGSVPVEWRRLKPETLLAMSEAFAADAPDAAERQWHAAMFAQAFERTEAAQRLADAAIKAKPELKAQREILGVR